MRRTMLSLALGVALLPGAVAPAGATTIDENGKIAADCQGFTLTFYGQGFEPDSSFDEVFVEWTVFLDRDGVRNPYTGSLTVSYAADGGASPVKAIRVPWGTDVCGENTIVSGGEFPAGFSWSNETGGSSRGPFLFNYDAFVSQTPRPAPQITAPLICPCGSTDLICRSPGFWGTHGGTEKRRSENITQAVLDAVGGINVCGRPIYETIVGSTSSALEAMCVGPEGDRKLQLARQLAAAALNCVMSGGGATCAGLPIAETFASCNDACSGMGGRGDREVARDCLDALECFNEGGVLLESGMCQIGTCNGDGVTACDSDRACAELSPDRRCGGPGDGGGARCIRTPGNCYDRALVNGTLGLDFDPEGPAGSSWACHEARRNRVTIFGTGGGGGCHH